MKKGEINEDAYFGVFYENHDNCTYIKANKEGLGFFINELKERLDDFEFHLSKEDHYAVINFKKEEWFDDNSHIHFDWIEPTAKSRKEIIAIPEEVYKSKWYDKITSFLWRLILFFLIASFLIGIFTTLKWLYKIIF
ncbi:MAG: hypothetical protein JKY44_00215 [Flavobacteriaceae bacterium]|nr:hypothetical protein [Flavobacteriaceae bacterium]